MIKKVSPLFLLVLFVASSVTAQTVIPLKKYAGNLKYIDVQIEGKDYKFLFDSGGGQTIISPAIARLLNKQPYGKNVSFRMSGEQVIFQNCDSVTLTIAGKEFSHPQLAVWDIMSVLPKELPPIDGLISLKTFAELPVTIDLPAAQLVVETPASLNSRTNTMQPVPSRFATGMSGTELTLFLGVPKNGETWWFLFDTANLAEVILAPSTAQGWGYSLQEEAEQQEIGNITLSPITKEANTAAIKNIIYDGALNYSTLSQKVYTISCPAHKVWISK